MDEDEQKLSRSKDNIVAVRWWYFLFQLIIILLSSLFLSLFKLLTHTKTTKLFCLFKQSNICSSYHFGFQQSIHQSTAMRFVPLCVLICAQLHFELSYSGIIGVIFLPSFFFHAMISQYFYLVFCHFIRIKVFFSAAAVVVVVSCFVSSYDN